MPERLTAYDPTEDLVSNEGIACFMAEAFNTQDTAHIAHALGGVARAKGMAQIATESGLSRKQLYRSFGKNASPSLKNTVAVMKALGIQWTAKI
jgi:probable addiction module antidote protein